MLTPSLGVKALAPSLGVKTYRVVNNAPAPSLGVKGFRSINLFRVLYSTASNVVVKLRSTARGVYLRVR